MSNVRCDIVRWLHEIRSHLEYFSCSEEFLIRSAYLVYDHIQRLKFNRASLECSIGSFFLNIERGDGIKYHIELFLDRDAEDNRGEMIQDTAICSVFSTRPLVVWKASLELLVDELNSHDWSKISKGETEDKAVDKDKKV